VAEIRIRNTNERITGEENVKAFLDPEQVLYEKWDPNKLPAYLRNKFVLTDGEKAEILAAYDEEIRDLAARRGYKIWDVIALSEETPNLEELLKKFEAVHRIPRMKSGPLRLDTASLSSKGQGTSVISMSSWTLATSSRCRKIRPTSLRSWTITRLSRFACSSKRTVG